jgi:hypothetical protein
MVTGPPYIGAVEITISLDEETVARAQELAKRRDMTLDEVIRELVEEHAADPPSSGLIEELIELWRTSSGDSRGAVWTREELHERSDVR